LEHAVFTQFYNRPVTIRRRMGMRAQLRQKIKPRAWHIPFVALLCAGLFTGGASLAAHLTGSQPQLKSLWYLVIAVPFIGGLLSTLGAGGAGLMGRVAGGALCGVGTAALVTGATVWLTGGGITAGAIVSMLVWRIFLFTLVSVMGVIVTEISLPEPKSK
jgi:hypothetical protein